MMMGAPVMTEDGIVGVGSITGELNEVNAQDAVEMMQGNARGDTIGDVDVNAMDANRARDMDGVECVMNEGMLDHMSTAVQVQSGDVVSADGLFQIRIPGHGIFLVNNSTEYGSLLLRLSQKTTPDNRDGYIKQMLEITDRAAELDGVTTVADEVAVCVSDLFKDQREVMVTFDMKRWSQVGMTNNLVLQRLPSSMAVMDEFMSTHDYKVMFSTAFQGIPSMIMKTTNLFHACMGSAYPTMTTPHYITVLNAFFKTQMPSGLVSGAQMHNLMCGASPFLCMSVGHSVEGSGTSSLFKDSDVVFPLNNDLTFFAQADRCYDLYWRHLNPDDACPPGRAVTNDNEVHVAAEAVRRILLHGKNAFIVDTTLELDESMVIVGSGDVRWPSANNSYTHAQLQGGNHPDTPMMEEYMTMMLGRYSDTGTRLGLQPENYVPVYARPRHIFVPNIEGENMNYFMGPSTKPPDPHAILVTKMEDIEESPEEMEESPQDTEEVVQDMEEEPNNDVGDGGQQETEGGVPQDMDEEETRNVVNAQEKFFMKHYYSRTIHTPKWFRDWFMSQIHTLSLYDKRLADQIETLGGDIIPDELPAFMCRRMMHLMVLFIAETIFYFRRAAAIHKFLEDTKSVVDTAMRQGMTYTREMAINDIMILRKAFHEHTGTTIECWEHLVFTSLCDLVRPEVALDQVKGKSLILTDNVVCGTEVDDDVVASFDGEDKTFVARRIAQYQMAATSAAWHVIDVNREDTKFINAKEMAFAMEELWDKEGLNSGSCDPMGSTALLLYMALERTLFMDFMASLSTMEVGPERNGFACGMEAMVNSCYPYYVTTIEQQGGLLHLPSRKNDNKILPANENKRQMVYEDEDGGGDLSMHVGSVVKRSRTS